MTMSRFLHERIPTRRERTQKLFAGQALGCFQPQPLPSARERAYPFALAAELRLPMERAAACSGADG